MFPAIELDPYVETLGFAEPRYLWLLAAPAVLFVMCAWRALKHRVEVHRWARARSVPIADRFTLAGGLGFWFCLLLAASLCILALARPQARVAVVDRAAIDLIVLQDASASMHVADVVPSRWQRSQQFMRVLAESLAWKGDRVALALFAHRAAPQLRLTKDPNALFFFFDHLGERPPFPLENDTTWDTNIEEGLYWGLKLVETDEALFGRSRNAKAFVVISDGQAWSGEVQRAVEAARERRIPVHVVGIGTSGGGLIPQPKAYEGEVQHPPIRSVLDSASLRGIAWSGGGEYFEIGREPDRDMAFRLIGNVRKRAMSAEQETSYEDLYWQCLVAAAAALGAGALFLRT
jgi:hypothetical protein